MPIIDLSEKTARGCGQLNKFSVRADGRDESAFIYDAQVVFVVSNSAEAEAVERLIPGAKETYQRATERDDWKAQQTVVPDIDGARVELRRSSDDEVAVQGGAVIKGVFLRASKRAVTLTVKVQMAGQTDRVATALTSLIGKPVDLLVEAAQQGLPFAGGKVPTVQLGSVVVARDTDGATVWGRVHDMDHDRGTLQLDVFGDGELTVSTTDVTTSWALVPGDATEKALRAYKTACKKAKVAPSYRAITVAVGEAYASEPPADGRHRLTDDVVLRAAVLTKDGFGGEPPAPVVTEPVKSVRRPGAGHRPSVPAEA